MKARQNAKQTHTHLGYRIHINWRKSQWEASIYPPRSGFPDPEILTSSSYDGDARVLAEAQTLIEARVAAESSDSRASA